MHECPKCGQPCDCKGDIDDIVGPRDSRVRCKCFHFKYPSEDASKGDESPTMNIDIQKLSDLADQRGQLMRDLTDKWTQVRVRFVERQRSQSKKIEELQIRERSLTWRIRELERVLMIIRQMVETMEPAEPRFSIVQHVERALPAEPGPHRGGYSSEEQE